MKKLSMFLIILLGLGFLISANADVCPAANKFHFSKKDYSFEGPSTWGMYPGILEGKIIKINYFVGATAVFGMDNPQNVECDYNVTYKNNIRGKADATLHGGRLEKPIQAGAWKVLGPAAGAVCNSSNPGDCPFTILR